MIIFSYKLEKYIKHKILPKLLIVPNRYIIKGSFRRKIPYITDIDIVNNVYPDVTKKNIYQEILLLLNRLDESENKNIIFIQLTCGTDNRFQINDASDEEIESIKKLITKDEACELDNIQNKYSNDIQKKKFFINELIWKYYKLRWTKENIEHNEMILPGNITIKFTDILEKNTTLLLQYYFKLQYPIGIDVIVNYEPIDLTCAYQYAADYQRQFANYSKEYYFMLFPFKFYFRKNKAIRTELENLIENKFGLYKQLIVRIDTYHILYDTGNLDIKTATDIVTTIIKDIPHLINFESNIPDQIKKVAINNTPDIKMEKWYILLDTLYDEINHSVNTLAKDYFFKYLNMLPDDLKKKYYLIDENLARMIGKKKFKSLIIY